MRTWIENLFAKNKFSETSDLLVTEPGKKIKRSSFGDNFIWGTAVSAYQTEGGHNLDGKGVSIWDTFTNDPKFLRHPENGNVSIDFYHRYPEDIKLLKSLNFKNLRLSLSWPRILPEGSGKVNQKGVDFYNKVIDLSLENGIEPWLTLYHWDLPQAIEDKGGWTNRDIVSYFSEYAHASSKVFGDRVTNWIVLNEPMSFTGLGYYAGYHAPGKKGISNFLAAAHHATLCQAVGAREIRRNNLGSNVGTAFSVTCVKPKNNLSLNVNAANRMDALLNRFFTEPLLGMGYPLETLPEFKRIEKYFKPGDDMLMRHDMDFWGIQYYFRTVAQFSLFPPLLWASEVPAQKRNVPVNAMNLEIYPKGLFKILKKFSHYSNLPKIMVTESGICLTEKKTNGQVHDIDRIAYHKKILNQIRKAEKKGIPVNGYFIWTFIDSFEWSEGVSPRFGLIYNDFETQERTIKDSGLWFKDFLSLANNF